MKPIELGDVIEVRQRVLPHFKGTGVRWEVIEVGATGTVQVAKSGSRGPRESTAMWVRCADLRPSIRLGDLVVVGRVTRPHRAAGQVHYVSTCSANVKPATHAHSRDPDVVTCPRCLQALEQSGSTPAPTGPRVVVDLWSYERRRPEKLRRIEGTREEVVRAALDHGSRCRLIEPWRDMLRMPRTLLKRSGGKRVQLRGPLADVAREIVQAEKDAALRLELEDYLEDLRRHGPSASADVAERLAVRRGRATNRLSKLRKAGQVHYEKRSWRAVEAA